LTEAEQSLEFAYESGGLSGAITLDTQTGNSGVIPGRPRRCIQATPKTQADAKKRLRGEEEKAG